MFARLRRTPSHFVLRNASTIIRKTPPNRSSGFPIVTFIVTTGCFACGIYILERHPDLLLSSGMMMEPVVGAYNQGKAYIFNGWQGLIYIASGLTILAHVAPFTKPLLSPTTLPPLSTTTTNDPPHVSPKNAMKAENVPSSNLMTDHEQRVPPAESPLFPNLHEFGAQELIAAASSLLDEVDKKNSTLPAAIKSHLLQMRVAVNTLDSKYYAFLHELESKGAKRADELFSEYKSSMALEIDQIIDGITQTLESHHVQLLSANEKVLRVEFEATLKKAHDSAADTLEQEASKHEEALQEASRHHKDSLLKAKMEIDRRWRRHVRTVLDQERSGRLAKLDHLAHTLSHLQSIAVDQQLALDAIRRQQLLCASLTSLELCVERGDSFTKPLLHLLHHSDSFIRSLLESISFSRSDRGVMTQPQLADLFRNSTYQQIRNHQFVQDPGSLEEFALSHLLTTFMFRKDYSSDGTSVEALVARARHALDNGCLDLAVQEVSNLHGWPRRVAQSWIDESRDALEVAQCLDAIRTHLTMKSFQFIL